ncbi:unnamed protein product, partial [Ectocarpus sp. 12 AP-2014]
MGCMQSKSTGLVLSEQDLKDCDVPDSECIRESANAVKAVHTARILHASSCKDDMTWDLLQSCRSVFITP